MQECVKCGAKQHRQEMNAVRHNPVGMGRASTVLLCDDCHYPDTCQLCDTPTPPDGLTTRRTPGNGLSRSGTIFVCRGCL